MNRMMAATISAGATTRGSVAGHVTAEPGVHHVAARRHEDEQEGPEQFGEDPAPLVAVVEEVELPPGRVRLPEGPRGDVHMTWRAHLRWRRAGLAGRARLTALARPARLADWSSRLLLALATAV